MQPVEKKGGINGNFSGKGGLPSGQNMQSSHASYVERLRSQPLNENEIRDVLKRVKENSTEPETLEMMEALAGNRAIRHPVRLNFRPYGSFPLNEGEYFPLLEQRPSDEGLQIHRKVMAILRDEFTDYSFC
jgi:hypothetical protein